MHKNPAVSIIAVVLNWNKPELTKQCITSLLGSEHLFTEIILFDNGSTDNSSGFLTKEFPQIKVIHLAQNLGFAEGNNQAIKEALLFNPDYLFLINNDVVIEKDTISRLIDAFSMDQQLGVVMSAIYYANDPNRIWSLGGRVNRNTGACSHIGSGSIVTSNFPEVISIDYPIGCAMLVKREIIDKIGLFWGPYFSYFEDVEFGIKVNDAGYRVKSVQNAKAWHHIMSTLGESSPYAVYLLTRNRFYFIKRNKKGFVWYKHGSAILLWYLRQIARYSFKHKSLSNTLATIVAFYDYILNKTGPARIKMFVK